ncbi:hypothetical protein ACFE04_004905 [Oxalis oulophora]
MASSVTYPSDFKILKAFKDGLANPQLLNWPDNNGDDPCGPPAWHHLSCSGDRVSRIGVKSLGLGGSLPQNFNHLSKLEQDNNPSETIMSAIRVLAVAIVGLIFTVSYLQFKKKEWADLVEKENNVPISLELIRKATDDFNQKYVLGAGKYGRTYEGDLNNWKVALKRLNNWSEKVYGPEIVRIEYYRVSQVRHRHIVALLGFCVEKGEMVLVYELMYGGPLKRYYSRQFISSCFSWITRLIIALDVAHAMKYLHSFARYNFIHRELNSSNILLDEKFRAKVSDFRLVEVDPDDDSAKSVYHAPEILKGVKEDITNKADVYSYGVVLMELMGGAVAFEKERGDIPENLVEWFKSVRSIDEFECYLDPALRVKKDYFPSICKVAELALRCTLEKPTSRPEMNYVVFELSKLVVGWGPGDDNESRYSGINYFKPLLEVRTLNEILSNTDNRKPEDCDDVLMLASWEKTKSGPSEPGNSSSSQPTVKRVEDDPVEGPTPVNELNTSKTEDVPNPAGEDKESSSQPAVQNLQKFTRCPGFRKDEDYLAEGPTPVNELNTSKTEDVPNPAGEDKESSSQPAVQNLQKFTRCPGFRKDEDDLAEVPTPENELNTSEGKGKETKSMESILHAETLAFLQAVQCAHRMQLDSTQIEGDCLNIVQSQIKLILPCEQKSSSILFETSFRALSCRVAEPPALTAWSGTDLAHKFSQLAMVLQVYNPKPPKSLPI